MANFNHGRAGGRDRIPLAKSRWKAQREVPRTLVQQRKQRGGTALDAPQLFTGINRTIFDDPCV